MVPSERYAPEMNRIYGRKRTVKISDPGDIRTYNHRKRTLLSIALHIALATTCHI